MNKINLGVADMYKLGIGYDDFKVMREEERYYIDKTNLIRDVINNSYPVMVFTRPKGFGKTLNLSMLRHFFDFKLKEENRKLFTDLNISKTKFMDTHFGEYFVIYFSLKYITFDNIESFKKGIKKIVINEYLKNRDLYEKLDIYTKKYFDYLFDNDNRSEDVYITNALKMLMEINYKIYGKKTILLIDDYDKPFQEAYIKGFYKDVLEYMKHLLNITLKTNEFLSRAVFTGELTISFEDSYCGINNIENITLLDDSFTEYFGIEEEEARQALKDYELEDKIEDVKKLYGGYIIDDKYMYNTWSLLNYLDKKILKAYCLNTSSSDLIEDILRKDENALEDLKELLEKGSIEKRLDASTLMKNINYKSIALLFFSGYLTIDKHIRENVYSLKIPNYEVGTFFENLSQQEYLKYNIEIQESVM